MYVCIGMLDVLDVVCSCWGMIINVEKPKHS